MIDYTDQAEKRLIGCLLLSRGDYLDDCKLRPQDFLGEWERAVFQAMLELRKANVEIDEITVGQTNPAWTVSLWDASALAVTAANASFYEKLIVDRNTRKAMNRMKCWIWLAHKLTSCRLAGLLALSSLPAT